MRAIDQCRAMVLIFSTNANESPQIRREVKRAFNRGTPVVPMRIENIDPNEMLSYYMDSVHWLDAITPPLEAHLMRLVESVKAFLQVDGAPSIAPIPALVSAEVTEAPVAMPLERVDAPARFNRRGIIAGLAAGTAIAGAGISFPYLYETVFPRERRVPPVGPEVASRPTAAEPAALQGLASCDFRRSRPPW